MAEIIQDISGKKGSGIRRTKKLSTKVDLTPMVDLGFLLITFFIFTTSMAKPMVMKLVMPADELVVTSVYPDSKTLTFVIDGNNKVFYYLGGFKGAVTETDFSATGIRKIIMNRKNFLKARFNDSKGLLVLIKLSKDCNYKNTVDALDEMLINEVTRYMILDADEGELAAVKK